MAALICLEERGEITAEENRQKARGSAQIESFPLFWEDDHIFGAGAARYRLLPLSMQISAFVIDNFIHIAALRV